MNELAIFNYEQKEVRTVKVNGEPWFVAKDVCEILELGRQQDSTRYLDDDEKGECLLNTSSGKQSMVTINEPGLYSLILRSRKPEAKAFKRWITHEVLPTIRKTGSYTAPNAPADTKALKQATQAFRDALGLAKMIGLTGNQAILSANKCVRKITGTDAMQLMEYTELPVVVDDHALTPTQLGDIMGLTGQAMNQMLCSAEMQVKVVSGKRTTYTPTKAGEKHAVLVDTDKKHSSGAPVTQLKWKKSVIAQFSGQCNR